MNHLGEELDEPLYMLKYKIDSIHKHPFQIKPFFHIILPLTDVLFYLVLVLRS